MTYPDSPRAGRVWAVLLREILLLRRKLPKQTASMAVSPLLYLLAFGYGLGQGVEVGGVPYLAFLIPGLAAMTSMTQAFAVASDINISRFYWRTFEEIQASPVTSLEYVLGQALAGMGRALLAVLVLLLLSWPFGVLPHLGLLFWVGVLLNALFFAAVGICCAMVVESHADQALIGNFVITPMAFLGGTFFPLDRLPWLAKRLLSLLPLTHASAAIRAAALDRPVHLVSLVYLGLLSIIFLFAARALVDRAKD